jgi:hypothetical protein
MTSFRFRFFTLDDRTNIVSIGGYTNVQANSQAEAQASLRRQWFAPWQLIAPLHGPSCNAQWFDSLDIGN